MTAFLVHKHLERVSGKLFEEYQQIIAEFARGQSGVYVLYSKNRIYYVGLASNLNSRLKQHLKDRHKGNWDTFSMYLTSGNKHLRELEALFHRVMMPTGNRQTGKLKHSANLKRVIESRIKQEQRRKLNHLLGKSTSNTSSKQNQLTSGTLTKQEFTTPKLAGYFPQATTLKAWYKGYEYTARVLRSGVIRFDGQTFDSPSSAGKRIYKRAVNGWWLWHYKDKSGEWVRLRTLRG